MVLVKQTEFSTVINHSKIFYRTKMMLHRKRSFFKVISGPTKFYLGRLATVTPYGSKTGPSQVPGRGQHFFKQAVSPSSGQKFSSQPASCFTSPFLINLSLFPRPPIND